MSDTSEAQPSEVSDVEPVATEATGESIENGAEGTPAPEPSAEDEHPLPGDDSDDGPGLERSLAVSEERLKSVLESLIFVADKPVTLRQLGRAAKRKIAEVLPVLELLQDEYADRGVNLVKVATGYQFRSALTNAPFVRDFVSRKPVRLSRAQLETLAIVGYRQPVTRPEVDDIRGVDSGTSLKALADRDLIKVLGRKDEPGRPLLYGTSSHFLEFFGLAALRDLPTLKEFTELSDESRGIFERRIGEALDLGSAEAEAQAAEAAAQEAMFGDIDEDEEDEDEEDAAGMSDAKSESDVDENEDDEDDENEREDDEDGDEDERDEDGDEDEREDDEDGDEDGDEDEREDDSDDD